MSALKAEIVPRNFSTIGDEFLVSFGQNSFFQTSSPEGQLTFMIRMVSTKATRVVFTFNEDPSSSYTINIPAGVTTKELTLEQRDMIYSNRVWNEVNNTASNTFAGESYERKSKKSLHIKSEDPISVYAMNGGRSTSDASNVLPVDNLGTTYYHISYPAASHYQDGGPNSTGKYYDEANFDGYTLIAKEDGTIVKVKVDGSSKNISLNAGEVYSYYTARRGSLSGEFISSNKPIAYFTTNSGTRIPSNEENFLEEAVQDVFGSTECLYQQLMPVSAWGKKFVVPISSRGKDRVRVMSSEDNTKITINGSTTLPTGVNIPWTKKEGRDKRASTSLTLSKGQYLDLDITTAFYLESSNPVGVCSFLKGNKAINEGKPKGDPAMAWIPSLEQTIESTTISAFGLIRSSSDDIYKAIIIVPTSDAANTTVAINNGAPQQLAGNNSYIAVPGSKYSYYSYDLDKNAAYTFKNPRGLTVMAYGYGGSESYYYMAGAAGRTINPHFTVEDIQHEDVFGRTFCQNGFEVKANIYSPYNSISWKVVKDGVQINNVAANNAVSWEMPESYGNGKYYIEMTVTYPYEDSKTISTEIMLNKVNISPESVSLNIGGSIQLTGSGYPQGQQGIWTSSNPAIATVNQSGIVSGLSSGTAYVTYEYNGCSKTIPISVESNSPIFFVDDKSYIDINGQVVCHAGFDLLAIIPGNYTSFVWEVKKDNVSLPVSNSTSWTVSEDYGKGIYNVKLTVYYPLSASRTMETQFIINTVEISPIESSYLRVEENLQLYGSGAPSGFTGYWSSADPNIATVSSTGLVHGVSPGTTDIVYYYNGCTTSISITVEDISLSFLVDGTSYVNMQGAVLCYTGFNLLAVISDNYTNISWEVKKDNTLIATNDDVSWRIPESYGRGTYYVKLTVAYSSGIERSIDAEFVMNVVDIQYTGSDSLNIGDKLQLTGSGAPIGLTGIWLSQNPSVATVDENGLVSAVGAGGTYIIYYYNGCANHIFISVNEVCPPICIWRGEVSSDWDIEDNWYPALVPMKCTDVYIPGIGVNNFPSLITGGSYSCKDIYFLPGGQLGQPQHLDYDNAYVQLDLGSGSKAQVKNFDYVSFVEKGKDIDSKDQLELGAGLSLGKLERSRFYMLSAPLKSTLTGDLAFGGYPFTYVRKFDTSASKENGTSFIAGRWSEFYSSPVEEFKPGEGFVYWVNEYKKGVMRYLDNNEWPVTSPEGMNKQPEGIYSENFGLAELNGILQLPYYNDERMSGAHRNHFLMPPNESVFWYFWQAPLNYPDFMQWTGDYVSFERTGATRFISEQVIDEVRTLDFEYNVGQFAEGSEGETLLIGNPYMSAFDVKQFFIDNYTVIKPVIQIWDGNKFEESVINVAKIAPMQSFIVQFKENITTDIVLKFNTLNLAKTDTSMEPIKASNNIDTKNRLCIKASNEEGSVSTYIMKDEEARDNFCDKDILKIIEYPVRRNIPEIYSLANKNSSDDKKALVYNYIKSNDITVPLGVATASSGNISLELSGMNDYDAEITFIDTESDIPEMKITDMDRFDYSFNLENKEENVNESRFFIRFSPKSTNISDIINNNLNAYIHNNDIIAVSSESNIKQVMVYDIQGNLLYQGSDINNTTHKIEDIARSSGIYLIKIQNPNNTKTIKVIKQ